MPRDRRVLVIDDVEKWSSEIVVTLRRSHYFAQSAASTTETFTLLEKELFHVLILDISMENDDPDNQDGLKLLKELQERNLNNALQIIMLSNYDQPDNMRIALVGYKVAGFLSKSSLSKKTLLDDLERVFTEEARINLALTTHWQGIGQDIDDERDVVLNLTIDDKKVEQDTPLQQLLFEELDDLLCRLFYEAKEITVHPIAPGRSATGVLSIRPFEGGFKNMVIVKFGGLNKIEQEHANFKHFVDQRLGGGRSTQAHNTRQTPHLGGIVYSFVGVTDNAPNDFGNFYRDAQFATIEKVLNNLFNQTCDNWYDNRSIYQSLDLKKDYQQLLHITPERLEQGLQALNASVQKGQRLHFQHLHEEQERTFTDPLAYIQNQRSFLERTFTCITHGDLNSHNIFIDSNNNTWLIDFLRTGWGHILRDLTQLDSVVRFELLEGQEASLDERYRLEELLCSIEHFQQLKDLQSRLSTENTALDKAFHAVLHIRTLAWEKLGSKASQHMREYYIGLLYHALNTLRFYDLSEVQREHALLSASLLTDKLHSSR